jgi:hypothetical protein
MSTSDAAGSWVDRVPRTPKREQQPWRSPEDAQGWTRIHRGEGRPRPRVGARLAVPLTPEQMDWVEERAAAVGLDVFAFVAKLIDDARAAEARAAARAKKRAG